MEKPSEKGEWAETAEDGIVPAEDGGTDAPREMLDEDPELGSEVLGETTGSDEPATPDGVDPGGGDEADATADGGPDVPDKAEPDLKDVGAASTQPDGESDTSGRLLGDGDVDRRAAPAADPDLLRHLHRVHRRGEHVAAAARRRSRRGRCRGRRDGPGPPGPPCRAAKGTSPSRISRIATLAIAAQIWPSLLVKSVISAVEHADHHALAHRRRLAGDLRAACGSSRRRR